MVKNPPVVQETQETWAPPPALEDPLRRAWQPTPAFLPGESPGQRSLAGYSPRGRKESDMNEHLHITSQEQQNFKILNENI